MNLRVEDISLGRLVHYGYDGKGRVNLVETKASAGVGGWTTIASGYAYEPFGPVKAMVLGNGLSVANDWGDDGRLASRRLYRTSGGTDLSYLAYAYDADDNIAAIRDQLNDTISILSMRITGRRDMSRPNRRSSELGRNQGVGGCGHMDRDRERPDLRAFRPGESNEPGQWPQRCERLGR